MAKKHRVSSGRRNSLCRQQGGRCMYCGRIMSTDKADAETDLYCTSDHVVSQMYDTRPIGEREVVAACTRCNRLKAHSILPVFLIRLTTVAGHTSAIGTPA